MAHSQNWFGLLPPDIATILPWSESLDKPCSDPLPGVCPKTPLRDFGSPDSLGYSPQLKIPVIATDLQV